MNLFEFGFFLMMVSAVILGSRELARLLAIPQAVAVLLIVGILVVLLRVSTKIRPRALLYLSALLTGVSLASLGLAKTLDLRKPLLIIPLAAGLIIIVISRLPHRYDIHATEGGNSKRRAPIERIGRNQL